MANWIETLSSEAVKWAVTGLLGYIGYLIHLVFKRIKERDTSLDAVVKGMPGLKASVDGLVVSVPQQMRATEERVGQRLSQIEESLEALRQDNKRFDVIVMRRLRSNQSKMQSRLEDLAAAIGSEQAKAMVRQWLIEDRDAYTQEDAEREIIAEDVTIEPTRRRHPGRPNVS